MSATISELRTAIAAAVDTIETLRATPIITDSINAPQAVVTRKPWVYDEVMQYPGEDAARTYLFGITVYVSRTNERTGQELLDELAEPFGDKSVKQVVESDADLDAMCDWALVREISDVQPVVHESGVTYLIEEFVVEVAV